MAKTTETCFSYDRTQALARLATPKEPGASERTQRRALSREYAAYAKEAAAALLPDVAATSDGFHDVWHTSGDDGYKSAIFHAAVRYADFPDDLPVILLLVCQGLEKLCCDILKAKAPSCTTQILPCGGVDGEASVGKVLLALPRGGGCGAKNGDLN
eukprot:symbB.v1.2.036638.t1/scaffold5216.1/size29738/2